MFSVFSAISWSASLLCSISSLKLPQRVYSGGISVRLIQPPFAYEKKSSYGLTDVSKFDGSIGGGLFSADGCGWANTLNAQRVERLIVMNDFIIFETR